MTKLKDLTGLKFNKLTVVEYGYSKNGAVWLCKCDCGNYTYKKGTRLLESKKMTCGKCSKTVKEKQPRKKVYGNKNHVTHGLSNTRQYYLWQHMKTRCYCKTNDKYKHYGARGIKICDEWLNDFQSFYDWSMENGYKENLTLDRIDVNGNYEPSNCRWVNQKEQMNNIRRNHIIEYRGKTQTLTQWCEELNIDYDLTKQRINKLHWNIEKAFNEPKHF